MEKAERRQNFIIHGLVNFALVCLVGICMLGCGLFTNVEAVSVYKSYRGVIYAGNEDSGKVALMINVYWGTEFLQNMLEILEKYDAKCTFFVGGTWVKENPDMLKLIYEKGHEIGNHGTNHKEHANLNSQQNISEIQSCHDEVKKVLGIDMNLFAPPGGSYSVGTVKAAESLGYKTILWTRDTIDWRDKDTNLIYSRAINNLHSGDLILMHPTACTRDALESILTCIKSKKLTPDTVSNTIKE